MSCVYTPVSESDLKYVKLLNHLNWLKLQLQYLELVDPKTLLADGIVEKLKYNLSILTGLYRKKKDEFERDDYVTYAIKIIYPEVLNNMQLFLSTLNKTRPASHLECDCLIGDKNSERGSIIQLYFLNGIIQQSINLTDISTVNRIYNFMNTIHGVVFIADLKRNVENLESFLRKIYGKYYVMPIELIGDLEDQCYFCHLTKLQGGVGHYGGDDDDHWTSCNHLTRLFRHSNSVQSEVKSVVCENYSLINVAEFFNSTQSHIEVPNTFTESNLISLHGSAINHLRQKYEHPLQSEQPNVKSFIGKINFRRDHILHNLIQFLKGRMEERARDLATNNTDFFIDTNDDDDCNNMIRNLKHLDVFTRLRIT